MEVPDTVTLKVCFVLLVRRNKATEQLHDCQIHTTAPLIELFFSVLQLQHPLFSISIQEIFFQLHPWLCEAFLLLQ